ncbi:hypothetical protein J4E93_004690 [Alternaria ventricosa]|uniref:uncharacterized protein n=1 Tax=Alternaria ventricosa TaxID=1187951 RepID=UPI0020C4574A|nr:uncharacterized protein J4E93_004690 [Alternaria ventricosa]KAI4648278.1 hypothetical protein J4E93_004690 [Alternaria ventricosa]
MAPIKKSPHVKPATRKLIRDGKIKDYFRVVPKEPPVSAKPPVPAQLSAFAKPFVPAKPAFPAKPPSVPAKPTDVRIDEHQDRSDVGAAMKGVSKPKREELHYVGFGQTDLERIGRAMLVEYQNETQLAWWATDLTYFDRLSETLLLQYEKEMVKLLENRRATKYARSWSNPGSTRKKKQDADVETRIEFEREQKAIIVQYETKMIQLIENKEAVEDTLAREIHYQNDVLRAYINLKEKLRTGNENNGNVALQGLQPPAYIRGEYTLYSDDMLREGIEQRPHWFKGDVLRYWRTGTLRLGQRWGDGVGPGAEVELAKNAHRITFTYTAPECPSTQPQSCEAYWHSNNVTAEAEIWFLGGAYLLLDIADISGETIHLHGILERDEEEMSEWWPGMPEWKPRSYYKTPYNPVLPQGRTRYLAPTAATGQDVRIQ